MDSAPINLTHHFLIAMPGLMDESFSRSVVFMCEHSERGALGLVINKPSDILLPRLFEKVDLPMGREDLALLPVFQGGPVQTERGFVLHEAVSGEGESVYASTLSIPGGLEMTTSKDVLEAMASGGGPRRVFVSLGYAFITASAIAKVVNVATNVGAIMIFGLNGAVIWQIGIIMGVANISGAIIGSRLAIKGGSELVRKVFLLVTIALILKVGIETF